MGYIVSYSLLNLMMASEQAETCRSINIITDNLCFDFLTFTLHTQRGYLNSNSRGYIN